MQANREFRRLKLATVWLRYVSRTKTYSTPLFRGMSRRTKKNKWSCHGLPPLSGSRVKPRMTCLTVISTETVLAREPENTAKKNMGSQIVAKQRRGLLFSAPTVLSCIDFPALLSCCLVPAILSCCSWAAFLLVLSCFSAGLANLSYCSCAFFPAAPGLLFCWPC